MGVHTSALEMVPFPKDIIRVDLDSKKIHPQQLRGLPKLPERQRTKLKATLQRLLLDYKESPLSSEIHVVCFI